MKFKVALLLTSLLSVPAFAQDRLIDISGFATYVYPRGSSEFEFDDNISADEIELETDQGWGAAVNVFWTDRVSTEFAASIVDPEITLAGTSGDSLRMLPITAVIQFHFFGAARIDPYIGIGGGYILFDDVETNELDQIDFERIDFEDDIGLVANAGVRIGLTSNFGIFADAKYIPLRANATPVFAGGSGQRQEIDIDPLILAAGISFSF